jgi:predicted nucleotidyltransferase
MTVTLLNVSGKIEPLIEQLLIEVNRGVSALRIPYFVAGASARDVVFGLCYGLNTGEATKDVDFAVALDGWDQYQTLIDHLLQSKLFEHDSHIEHRLTFRKAIKLDLVPFGGVENPAGRLAWPPDGSIHMTTLGFREAFNHAIQVTIAPDTVIPFASPAGLALLKLFAWNERRLETHGKDARDLALVLRNYLNVGNANHLYDNHADLLESEDFDYELAGARILGRDLASWLDDSLRKNVEEILDRGLSKAKGFPLARDFSLDPEKAILLLESFRRGLQEQT